MSLNLNNLCEKPIFIVGSPRSGSSILAYSLAAHDALWTSGESHFLWRMFGGSHIERHFKVVKEWPGGSWLADQNVSRSELFESIGLGINALFSSRSGGKRWIDQTPYYVYMLEQLGEMFPGAQFIHVLRDGREIVNSMIHYANALDEQSYGVHIGAGRLNWSRNFSEACREWKSSVEAALAYQKRCPDRMITVRYDELCSEPEPTFSKLLNFLGLERDPRPAEYLRENRINSSFPIGSAGKVCRVRSPRKLWLHWTEEKRQLFRELAGQMLVQLQMATPDELDCVPAFLPLSDAAKASIPSGSAAIVVSDGDETILNLGNGRKASHFPQTPEGWFGGHPKNDAAAIELLANQVDNGAMYLVIPDAADWWLDFYSGFASYLASNCRLVWNDESGLVYRIGLSTPRDEVNRTTVSQKS